MSARSSRAQTTPVTIVQGQYFESFDSMGASGTTYPAGWNGYKITGLGNQLTDGAFITGSTNPPFTVSNGGDNTGTIYNYGTTGASDRALGSVATATTTPGFGVVLENNAGRVLGGADILIAFRSEQWRSGSSNNDFEHWTFEWRTGDATLDVNDPSSVGWTAVPALDLVELQNQNTSGSAIDGHAVGNFADISGTLAGLIWNPGDRLVLRWLDSNSLGADAGMAIDRFSFWVFAPVPEPTTAAACGVALVAFLAVRRRRAVLQ